MANRKPNAWYTAICSHLQDAGTPLTVDQIWERMISAGFKHKSVHPRSTLGARITELAQLGKLERTARKTYQLTSLSEQ